MPWFLNIGVPDERYAWVPDVFSEEECKEIILLGKELKLEKAKISKESLEDNSIRKCEISWLENTVENNFKYEWIYRRCTDAVNLLNEKFFNYDLTYMEEIQFTAYTEKGSFYEKHIDVAYHGNGHRKLSFSVQLSQRKSYSGGSLFLYNAKEPDVCEKEIGTLIVFPSWTLHEVTPVTEGERYALVGWTHGPRFK
jgi:PKHD-type hydroxylase